MECKCRNFKHSEFRISVAVVMHGSIAVMSVKKKVTIFCENYYCVCLDDTKHISCFTEYNNSFIKLKIHTFFQIKITYPSFLKTDKHAKINIRLLHSIQELNSTHCFTKTSITGHQTFHYSSSFFILHLSHENKSILISENQASITICCGLWTQTVSDPLFLSLQKLQF